MFFWGAGVERFGWYVTYGSLLLLYGKIQSSLSELSNDDAIFLATCYAVLLLGDVN